mgnify:CR=1 FL=1|tara:strand:+ start:18925 stop:20034 length:1110 start_codon:yes stop_codon:yes gene_type:complete
MQKKICLIYNFAQHYRLGIFKLLDQKLNCDFYFGNTMDDVKKLNYSELKHFKEELFNIKLISRFYWQKGIFKILSQNYTDYIILGEYYCLSTWYALIYSKFSNKKVYLWTHGWYGNEGSLKTIIKKAFFNLSDGIFLYGNWAKDLMVQEGFLEKKLHVIYNSLDYENQYRIRQNLKKETIFKDYFKNDFPVIIFIGRLTKIKKLNQIIETQKVLIEKGKNINVVFIGKGEEENTLKKQVNDLNLQENVWFYGPSYNEEEIGKLVYNADLCVSPGNVGLTAIHVMSYGTPVATHKDFTMQMPEYEAIQDKQTGFFFEKNSINSMVTKIEDWIFENKYNRENIRDFCYKIIDLKFNPDYQLKIIKSVIYES